jgi:hypothetical protein
VGQNVYNTVVLELPSFEARTKAKDPRYCWYVKNYGDQAWELDAMDPEELRQRVESHIVARIDKAAWERHEIVEEPQLQSIRMVAAELEKL